MYVTEWSYTVLLHCPSHSVPFTRGRRRLRSTRSRRCQRPCRPSWQRVECRVCWAGMACLVRRTSPLPAWTHESRVRWVSCVLSWHVLSEGQVHYQRGHASLECVECRVCWADTSCQKDKSTTSVDTLSLECVECRVCWADTSCQKNKSTISVDVRV